MRLAQELSEAHVEKFKWDANYAGVFWKREVSQQYVEGGDKVTKSQRLKWILAETMGSANAFENRRKEIANAKQCAINAVGDEQVTKTFIDSVSRGGLMREYLQRGKLAAVLGDSIFLHGALAPECAGWLPPAARDESGRCREADVREWARKLNAFATRQVESWCAHVDDTGYDGSSWAMVGGYTGKGGDDLMQYCMGWMPDGERNPTIVYRDWMKGAKMGPRTPSSDVAEYMTMSGIHRCISGHKPHGDVPLTIRAAEGDFTAITCDTSYSGRILGAGEIDHAALQRQWRTRVVASATSMCSPLPHRPVQLCPALPQSTCRPPHPPPFPLPSSFSILSVAIAKM